MESKRTDLPAGAARITTALAGTAATWALDLGLRSGALAYLRAAGPSTPGAVAAGLDLDPQYTAVMLRAVFAAEMLDRDGDRYVLSEPMATLLLDVEAPGYLGGAVHTFVALRETFTDLRRFVATGQRESWADFDPEWIEAVGENGQTYYRRLLDVVLPQLPGVQPALQRGLRYLDLACGLCRGPAKIARAFPGVAITAVDSDAYSLSSAEDEIKRAGLSASFSFHRSMLEELEFEAAFDLAVINISLHEARDIERAVARAHAALAPGGVFVVSEFPFPETVEGCRSVPGQLMCGVQFFEAHIGCQLLPTSRFVELLEGAGFADVGVVPVTPMHVVIHGTRRS
jgi:SAM-dependent methyltransferase